MGSAPGTGLHSARCFVPQVTCARVPGPCVLSSTVGPLNHPPLSLPPFDHPRHVGLNRSRSTADGDADASCPLFPDRHVGILANGSGASKKKKTNKSKSHLARHSTPDLHMLFLHAHISFDSSDLLSSSDHTYICHACSVLSFFPPPLRESVEPTLNVSPSIHSLPSPFMNGKLLTLQLLIFFFSIA